MANHHLLLFLLLSVFIGSISAHAFPDHPHRHVFRRDSGINGKDFGAGCELSECYLIGYFPGPDHCKRGTFKGVVRDNCRGRMKRSICCE